MIIHFERGEQQSHSVGGYFKFVQLVPQLPLKNYFYLVSIHLTVNRLANCRRYSQNAGHPIQPIRLLHEIET
ncbi:hypothetical protein DIZ81_01975 [Legionella taurinensis]|uniref:Uncharacterized protein n=1 Tax=Legionella taurinensis TaxID=70611 RepID=A0A3A5L9S7_9GAMM|nr:hypothetical protein DB744_01980 [Legionella taurinensis]PUT44678.1 hypothetical protein DB746_01980 [Legionella taurinensis]PUT47998.1 hypothetical protein DB743_00140 [Legionella taurinensis]PUT48811.1 hypothetical protein DB745_01980 [Legionella taurinensis]RJT45881.1 hypothetical protein D6J04_09790 [Legionella taurinensis]